MYFVYLFSFISCLTLYLFVFFSKGPDPRTWGREDVLTFLRWCEREFDLPGLDLDKFQMNGTLAPPSGHRLIKIQTLVIYFTWIKLQVKPCVY